MTKQLMRDDAVSRGTDIRYWDDIGYAAVLEAETEYAHVVARFKVYEIAATQVTEIRDGQRHTYERGFQRAGASMHPDPVEDISEAEVFLSCSIRWDGCSDWDCDGGFHFCEKEQAEHVGTLFARLYEWGRELGMDRC